MVEVVVVVVVVAMVVVEVEFSCTCPYVKREPTNQIQQAHIQNQ